MGGDDSKGNGSDPTEAILINAMNKLAGIQHVVPIEKARADPHAVQLNVEQVFAKFYQHVKFEFEDPIATLEAITKRKRTAKVFKEEEESEENSKENKTKAAGSTSGAASNSAGRWEGSGTLFVKLPTEKLLTVEVKSFATETVEALMMKVEKKASINHGNQRLLYQGNYLSIDRTLADCNVQPNSTLDLRESFTRRWKGAAQLFIKTLTGQTRTIEVESFGKETVEMVMAKIQDMEGVPVDQQRLIFDSEEMEKELTLADYNVGFESTVTLVRTASQNAVMPSYYIDLGEIFEEKFNFDFRNIRSDNGDFYRGEHRYQRPLGSMRYAIRVLGKYPDNDWLGPLGNRTESAAGEWPVAYHGTKEVHLGSILKEGLRITRGMRFAFGRGIYCTPDPRVALEYAEEYQLDGKSFKLILQTRVDPTQLKKVPADRTQGNQGEYWLLPDETHIRPYGVCVYEG